MELETHLMRENQSSGYLGAMSSDKDNIRRVGLQLVVSLVRSKTWKKANIGGEWDMPCESP